LKKRKGKHMSHRPISNKLEIKAYLHCGKCIEEWNADCHLNTTCSPADYSRTQAGWTELGLQVWCNRHNCNVVHIDFEGCKHPANVTAPRPQERGE